MSVIGHREWQVWTNMDFFGDGEDIRGVVHFKITPSLMAEQTIGFLYEKLENIRKGEPQFDNQELQNFFDLSYITPTNELVIQRTASISRNTQEIEATLCNYLDDLAAISLCLDFPLTCNEIRFIVPPMQPENGEVFIAARKQISRGMAFEIEERGAASARLANDFEKFKNFNPIQKAAQKHYINGLTLLALEDQFSGLIDAAFMQFYQACEILCGENYKLKEVKKHIAEHCPNESRKLQIIAHHVWQIRHEYFGHGNVENHIVNIEDIDRTFDVAKQVLVARWLCKRLLDLSTNSNPLAREMRLYHKSGSVCFSGRDESIPQEFYIAYKFNPVPILDSTGNKIAEVNLG
ncbi:MAG TPA: hypothetical protein ENK21_03090 [Trueperaceae bacterium]|nr:hypothetical protein [Trueperaceae bacterium]